MNQIKKFFFEYEGPTLNLKNIILSPFWPLFTQNPQKIFVSVLKFYVAATKYEKLKKKKNAPSQLFPKLGKFIFEPFGPKALEQDFFHKTSFVTF